jgi:hypothetical protein
MSMLGILVVLAMGAVGESNDAARHLSTHQLPDPRRSSNPGHEAALQSATIRVSAPRRAVAQSAQCEGPGVDPWVTDLRDRVMRYNGLAQFAVERYGASTACEGAVTSEFDGAKFGRVVLTFGEGVTLAVETEPPESSSTTLRASGGFGEEAEVRALLREEATRGGLSIDWTTPEVRTEGAEVVHQFWDPEPGLNASASLIFLDGTLVGVRLSMAL